MTPLDSIAVAVSGWQVVSRVQEPQNCIHVWAITLRRKPSYLQTLYSWLSDLEKSRARRVVIDWKRDHQIQARGWLRWLLSGYTGTTPRDIAYRYGNLGKPGIVSPEGSIHFNATDSGDMLLCAFSRRHELGIDVEQTPRRVRYEQISEKKFNRKEQQTILALPPVQRQAAFLALWTRKEAYGKAIGQGIRYPMKNVHLCDGFETADAVFTGLQNRTWRLVQFRHGNYIACLASDENSAGIRYYQLDIDSTLAAG